jgi:hypothetical protein
MDFPLGGLHCRGDRSPQPDLLQSNVHVSFAEVLL